MSRLEEAQRSCSTGTRTEAESPASATRKNTRKRRRSAFVEATAKLADVASTQGRELVSSPELDTKRTMKRCRRSTKAPASSFFEQDATMRREQEARVLAVFDKLVSLTYELYCDAEENHHLYSLEVQQAGEYHHDDEYHEEEPRSQQVRHNHDGEDDCTGVFGGSLANDEYLPVPIPAEEEEETHQEPADYDSFAGAPCIEFAQYTGVPPEAVWWSLAHQIKDEPEDNEVGDDAVQLGHGDDVFAAEDDTDLPMMQEDFVYPTSTYGIEDFIAGAPLLPEATEYAGQEAMGHHATEQHPSTEPSEYEETVLASGSLMGGDEDYAKWCASVFA